MSLIDIQIEMIQRVQGVFSSETHWCRNNRAESADGQDVNWMHSRAAKWSLIGAFLYARDCCLQEANHVETARYEVQAAFDELFRTLKKIVLRLFLSRTVDGPFVITRFNQNENTTFDDVLTVVSVLRQELRTDVMVFDHLTEPV